MCLISGDSLKNKHVKVHSVCTLRIKKKSSVKMIKNRISTHYGDEPTSLFGDLLWVRKVHDLVSTRVQVVASRLLCNTYRGLGPHRPNMRESSLQLAGGMALAGISKIIQNYNFIFGIKILNAF